MIGIAQRFDDALVRGGQRRNGPQTRDDGAQSRLRQPMIERDGPCDFVPGLVGCGRVIQDGGRHALPGTKHIAVRFRANHQTRAVGTFGLQQPQAVEHGRQAVVIMENDGAGLAGADQFHQALAGLLRRQD